MQGCLEKKLQIKYIINSKEYDVHLISKVD